MCNHAAALVFFFWMCVCVNCAAPHHRWHAINLPKPNGCIVSSIGAHFATKNSFLFMFISSASHLVQHTGHRGFFPPSFHLWLWHTWWWRAQGPKSNTFAEWEDHSGLRAMAMASFMPFSDESTGNRFLFNEKLKWKTLHKIPHSQVCNVSVCVCVFVHLQPNTAPNLKKSCRQEFFILFVWPLFTPFWLLKFRNAVDLFVRSFVRSLVRSLFLNSRYDFGRAPLIRVHFKCYLFPHLAVFFASCARAFCCWPNSFFFLSFLEGVLRQKSHSHSKYCVKRTYFIARSATVCISALNFFATIFRFFFFILFSQFIARAYGTPVLHTPPFTRHPAFSHSPLHSSSRERQERETEIGYIFYCIGFSFGVAMDNFIHANVHVAFSPIDQAKIVQYWEIPFNWNTSIPRNREREKKQYQNCAKKIYPERCFAASVYLSVVEASKMPIIRLILPPLSSHPLLHPRLCARFCSWLLVM